MFANVIPDGHTTIIDELLANQYKVNIEGICFGIVHAWVQAAVTHQLKVHDARLRLICGNDEASKRISKNDIAAYFDTVAFCNEGENYHSIILNNLNSNQNGLGSLSVVMSKSLEEAGGMTTYPAFSGAYEFSELVDYLTAYKNCISKYKFTAPIVLETLDHVLAFFYDYKEKKWCFFDPNFMPTQYFDDEIKLAKAIFLSQEADKYLLCVTRVYCIKKNAHKLKKLDMWLDQLKSIRKVTPEKAAYRDKGVTWAHMTVSIGELPILCQLLPYYIDINEILVYGTLLYEACSFADVVVISYLLMNKEIDPNLGTISKNTPLMIAAQYDFVEVIAALLSHSKTNIDQKRLDGSTALLIAAEVNAIASLRFLIHQGADVNLTRVDGTSALYMAAQANSVEAVEILVAHGADINLMKKNSESPLFVATFNKNLNVIRLLIAKDIDVVKQKKNISQSIYFAAQHNEIDLFILLLSIKNIQPNTMIGHMSPLYIATLNGHIDIVRAFLADERTDPNVKSRLYGPAIHAAITRDRVEILKLLLMDKRVDADIKHNGVSPLQRAEVLGNQTIIRLLSDHQLKSSPRPQFS